MTFASVHRAAGPAMFVESDGGSGARLSRRRELRARAGLTAGLWTVALVSFAVLVAIGQNGLSGRLCLWLLLITASGAVVSAGVCALFDQMKGLAVWPRRSGLVLIACAAAGLQALLDAALLGVLQDPTRPGAWILPPEMALNSVLYFWLFGVYVCALEMMAMSRAAVIQSRLVADYERRLGLARELATEAQLRLLRFQLDPDFIFNVLNNISSMVVTGDLRGAERSIARLCRFLRASALAGGQEIISLSTELATVEAYLDIEALRLTPRPQVTIECPPALLSADVPALILQPLVEHAVRRLRALPAGPVWITIRVAGEPGAIQLSVTSPGGPEDSPPASAEPLEVTSTRRRLEILYDEAARLQTDTTDGVFTATLFLTPSPMRGAP